MNKKLTEAQEIVLSLISEGKENAKYIRDISNVCGYSSRDIKYIIQDLRLNGYPVCTTTYDGVWLAKNKEELNETIGQFESRRVSICDTLNALYLAQRKLS